MVTLKKLILASFQLFLDQIYVTPTSLLVSEVQWLSACSQNRPRLQSRWSRTSCTRCLKSETNMQILNNFKSGRLLLTIFLSYNISNETNQRMKNVYDTFPEDKDLICNSVKGFSVHTRGCILILCHGFNVSADCNGLFD